MLAQALLVLLPAIAGAAPAQPAARRAVEELALAAFAGEYASATMRCRFFTSVDGARLYAQLAGGAPLALRRTGETTFEYDKAKDYAKAEFALEDGVVVGVRLTRGPRTYDLQRAVITGDDLGRFAGRFASPTFRCRVLVVEDRLRLQLPDQQPLELVRIGPNVFTHGEDEELSTLEFVLAEGRAVALRWTRGGVTVEAEREEGETP